MSEAVSNIASWRDYLEMCKPNVVLLMLLCALVGMVLATPGSVPLSTVILGLTGIGLVAGSAAVVNHIADAHIDARMARTQARPMANGRVSNAQGMVFSAIIGVVGMLILWFGVNPLTAWLNLASWVGYGLIYTFWLKRATPQNIVIGGLFGAPAIVWLDCGDQFDGCWRPVAGADHFCLDATALLGAGAGPQRRIRRGRCANVARHPW